MEFHRVCSISLVRGGKNSNETLICPWTSARALIQGIPLAGVKKAHTLPHQSLVVICCVVHIYPFRRPDVKMKEKPKGVNRKMTNDGEEKSGKMKKLQDGKKRKSGMQSKPDCKYKLTMYLLLLAGFVVNASSGLIL